MYSRPHGEKTYIRFINKTNRAVELIWLNYSGAYVRYKVLQKDNFFDVTTYKNHPWIALDINTKDRLLIEKDFVYNPKTTREYLQEKFPDRDIPQGYETRIRVNINLPLYSLKYRCMIEVRNCFKFSGDVDELELPKSLADELKHLITQRSSQLEMEIVSY